ncbi:MAG: ferric reductase-like transmembrane domain-containing protein [Acidimicrobiia bacterium]|nr:ferric reductase-like transmembrane domain-containing protein [Acidimicrobiia bacterium]
MNEQIWWYTARAGGIVAWVLLALSVAWGLLLSTRLVSRRGAPAWLLDLHRFLGALALVFTLVHIAGLVADSYVQFGWSEVLVPMASEWKPGPVAWGIVGFYLLVAVEVTSLLMKRMSRKAWRAVHFTSFGLFAVSAVHGSQSGTDATNIVYRVTSVALVSATMFLTLVRILSQRRSRRAARVAPSRSASPAAA